MRFVALLWVCSATPFACAQDASVVAKCLGQPFGVYGKVFHDTVVETAKTDFGTAQFAMYKSGTASVHVYQLAGQKIPTVVVAGFYQWVNVDWQKAIVKLGLPANGASATNLPDGRLRITGISGLPHFKIEGLFNPKDSKYFDDATMRIVIRKQ